MPSLRKRGAVWYFRYVDASGVKREHKGCRDKAATLAMAAAVEVEIAQIKGGFASPKDIGYRDHEARPLADHLDDWHRDMRARGKTDRHADQYRDRAGKLVALIRGAKLVEVETGRGRRASERAAATLAGLLNAARLTDLTPERIQAALAALRDAGKSNQTANHYRAALRAFVRWAGDKGRLRDNPMRGVHGYNVQEGPRRERRALTDEELARLIDAAGRGPVAYHVPGPLRAMAYWVAASTGFRVAELRALTPESFRLDGPEPTVSLKAGSTKNRRPVTQPVPLALAHALSAWLRGQPAGGPVFLLHHETAKAIRRDLDAAGIPYATDEGRADFHSLRAYYISALVRAGASIKEVQALARHAQPQTTLNHYAKVSARDLRGAVESLPAPAPVGTDGRPISNGLAHHLPTAGGKSGRVGSEAGAMALAGAGKCNTPEIPSVEGFGRVLSVSVGSKRRGGDSRRGPLLGACSGRVSDRIPKALREL
jgi:integrase